MFRSYLHNNPDQTWKLHITKMLWIECLCPLGPKFICWNPNSLPPCNVAVFGDGAFKEGIKFKWGPKDGALIRGTGILIKRRDMKNLPLPTCCVSTQWDGGHRQARKSALTRSHILSEPRSWTFQPPEPRENKFPLFTPPSPWSFVRTALGEGSAKLPRGGRWWSALCATSPVINLRITAKVFGDVIQSTKGNHPS